MKKTILLCLIICINSSINAQNLTIRNYTNCPYMTARLYASDAINPTCGFYYYDYAIPSAITYFPSPNNLTSTPSTITWSDPTAPGPWYDASLNTYFLNPSNIPTWSYVEINGCNRVRLALNCSTGTSGTISDLCFPSTCSATGQIHMQILCTTNCIIRLQE